VINWEALLKDAAERVQEVSDSLANSKKGKRQVMLGAGGDKTLYVDLEAEKKALKVIQSTKDVHIITEERGELRPLEARWTVVIDPIDGSSNLERGIPFYCTSFAVFEGTRLKDIKYALVRNLVNGDVYYAESGNGSTKNGRKMKTSKIKELSKATIAVDTCRASVENVVRTVKLTSSIKRQSHFGANALEICFLGEGKIDGFVDVRGRMRITDLAGSYLIAKEAGAIFTSINGEELESEINLRGRFNVIASANRVLHRKILERVQQSQSILSSLSDKRLDNSDSMLG
jgi:myo-inositol-1(or 4)-monophosphatase